MSKLDEAEKDYEYAKNLLGRLMELVTLDGDPDYATLAFVQELKDQGFGLPPESVVTDESVPLIASGYEWTCLNCDQLNREIEVRQTVECVVCHHVYSTDEPDHAFGD